MRDALLEMHRALLEGRKADHLSAFVGSDAEMRVVEALYGFYRAGRAFRERYVAAYGPDEWEDLRYDKKSRLYLPPEDTTLYEHAVIETTGEGTAEATVVSGKLPMTLRKTEDGWRVEASSMVPPSADAAKVAELTERWTEILRTQRDRIGTEGLDAGDIREALGEQFARAARDVLQKQ
jgi:hypothetical protein